MSTKIVSFTKKKHKMEVTQEDNKYVIRIPMDAIDAVELEKLLHTIRLQEILNKRTGTEEQASEMARAVNQNWWLANQHRFLK